jgi:hypothetical protein
MRNATPLSTLIMALTAGFSGQDRQVPIDSDQARVLKETLGASAMELY